MFFNDNTYNILIQFKIYPLHEKFKMKSVPGHECFNIAKRLQS